VKPLIGTTCPGPRQSELRKGRDGANRIDRVYPTRDGDRVRELRDLAGTRVNGQSSEVARLQLLVGAEPSGDGARQGTAAWLTRLCHVAVRELDAAGVGISLMTGEGSSGTAAASDATSEIIEELQFTLGEGPCMDAFATQRPVLAPDLSQEASSRWPWYSPAAQGHGVGAVFAFPLQVGAARLGALDVYRRHPGSLSSAATTLALTFAHVATMTLLAGQEDAADGQSPDGIDEALETRYEVHQAQGMVMVQLEVTLVEAMARLRAYAYLHDRRLGVVARDIVTRSLTLERDDQ